MVTNPVTKITKQGEMGSKMRKPHFSKERQRWFLRLGSKNIDLGVNKEEAFKKYHGLMAGQITAPTGALAVEIIDQFLDWSKSHQAESTFKNYSWFLKRFKEFIGSIKLKDLKPFYVTRWLDRQGWKGNTANGAVRAAVRPFSWAAKMGVIENNQLTNVERPSPTPRECYISPAQFDQLFVAVQDEEFRDVLMILRETGCRPQEMRSMEARHFNRVGQTITFPRLESKGKKRQRIIVLTPAAMAIIQRLAMKHQTGPLFRNVDGAPWKGAALICRFERLRRKLNFPVSAYVLRHAWVTDALMNGVEPLTVATLAGHASIKMVWSVYQSLQLQRDHMREAAIKAVSRAS